MRFTVILGVLMGARAAIGITPDLGLDVQYRFVGECGGGSATAIGRRAVITAKHVPGYTVGIEGQIYTAVQRMNHPVYDLAILLFNEDLPGWYPLGDSAPVGTPVVWVGYGGVGYANNEWHGYDIRYGNYGRHAATNRVYKKWSMFGLGPALVSMLDDNPDAAGVNGDSGGAVFTNGRLVGVISYAFNESGGQLPNYGFALLNGGQPYHGSGAIDLTVPEIRRWILRALWPPKLGFPGGLGPQGEDGRLPSPWPFSSHRYLELPFYYLGS